jgi:hypothetical protein
MKLFREEMGLGSAANTLLQGTFQIEYEVGSAVTAWINAVRQTDRRNTIHTPSNRLPLHNQIPRNI